MQKELFFYCHQQVASLLSKASPLTDKVEPTEVASVFLANNVEARKTAKEDEPVAMLAEEHVEVIPLSEEVSASRPRGN